MLAEPGTPVKDYHAKFCQISENVGRMTPTIMGKLSL